MKAFFLFTLLSSFSISAITISFENPYTKEKHSLEYSMDDFDSEIISVSDVTLEALATLAIAEDVKFKANFSGVRSVFSTPTDLDAYEIISDVEMKAFGWCYKVNGVLAEKLMDEVTIDSEDAHVEWFYGYAHYLKGDWIGQCLKESELR